MEVVRQRPEGLPVCKRNLVAAMNSSSIQLCQSA